MESNVLRLIASLQFLTTGVLSELISRTYFESSKRENYVIYHHEDDVPATDDDWSTPNDRVAEHSAPAEQTVQQASDQSPS